MAEFQAPPVVEGRQAEDAWRVLWLLVVANLLNVYNRVIPAVIAESRQVQPLGLPHRHGRDSVHRGVRHSRNFARVFG